MQKILENGFCIYCRKEKNQTLQCKCGITFCTNVRCFCSHDFECAIPITERDECFEIYDKLIYD